MLSRKDLLVVLLAANHKSENLISGLFSINLTDAILGAIKRTITSLMPLNLHIVLNEVYG